MRDIRKSIRLSLILLGLIATLIPAQRAAALDLSRSLTQFRIDSWSVRDGLPAQPIVSMAQTPDGFIWIGSVSGLIRFDGATFDVYNSSNTPSLPAGSITALMVARDGVLWLGTEWGGFGRFVGGRYIPCEPPTRHWSFIHAIVEDASGAVWVAGWGDVKLFRVRGSEVRSFDVRSSDPGVNALLPLSDGSILCGLPWDGIKRLRPDGSLERMWPKVTFGFQINALAQTPDGSIWVGVGDTGVFQLAGRAMRRYTVRDGLGSNNVTSLRCDRSGRLVVGTTNGVCVWNSGKPADTRQAPFTAFDKNDGLSDSVVGPTLDDSEGNLWVAAGVG